MKVSFYFSGRYFRQLCTFVLVYIFLLITIVGSAETINHQSDFTIRDDVSGTELFPIKKQPPALEMNRKLTCNNISQKENLPVNECFYCREKWRPWYNSFHELRDGALLCGYDRIEIRFDETFNLHSFEITITVFLHNNKETVYLDSIVYKLSNNNDMIKRVHATTSENKVTISHKDDRVLAKTGEGIDRDIAYLRLLKDSFSSRVVLDTSESEVSIYYTLGDNEFLLTEGHISRSYTPLSDYYRTAPLNIHFRLESEMYYDICDSLYKDTIDPGPRILSAHVTYPQKTCRINLEAFSETGIDNVTISDGTVKKSFLHNGEHSVKMSTLFLIPDTSHSVVIEVVDKNYRAARVILSVFDSLREEKEVYREKREIQKARKEWGNKNAAHKVAQTISSFSGNPVSYVLNKIVTNQAKTSMQRKYSFLSKDTCPIVNLPTKGRIILNEISPQIYRYAVKIIPKHLKGNLLFESNVLKVPEYEQHQCHVQLDIPIGSGHLVPSLKIRKDLSTISSEQSPIFLLCNDVQSVNDHVTIGTLPMIINKPARELGYTAVVWDPDCRNDTLSLMYVVTFLDKSRTTFFRELILGMNSGNKSYHADKKMINLSWNTDYIKSYGLISREDVTCSDKIMRLDAFVYSTIRNETFGAGTIWVQ